jgi:hypothetical protein
MRQRLVPTRASFLKVSLILPLRNFSTILKSTAMKANGLKEISNHKQILGVSDIETVKLDLDDVSFSKVKYWASRAKKRFRLRGFTILKSSRNRYHVVFYRKVSWKRNMSVVACVALLSQNNGLVKWLLM